MNGRIAMIDGQLVPLERASVSVLDRGFLYGDSVFETLRTYGGEPFAIHEHLERLARSAALVHIALPTSLETLGREIHEAILAAGNPESYVRVTVTRGTGELGLDPSLATGALRVIIVTPLHAPPLEQYERGIRVATFRAARQGDGTVAAGAKIGNYLVSVLAMRAAKAAGGSEALIVDAAGRVVEGATSNVFFARGKRILTPSEDDGILLGITQSRLIQVARERGYIVELGAPALLELHESAAFEEVFISSSIRELLAVVEIDGHPVGSGVPGPVYRELLAAFREKVRSSR